MCISNKKNISGEKRKYLAVIPARQGSKRLPQKNILPLRGRPLISWTLEAAKTSKSIDSILVTSDDDEVLRISASLDCRYIKRPKKLALDTSTSFSVVEHAVNNMPWHEYIILLQPTSPLRTGKHIDEAIQLLEEKNADAVISVTKMEHNPLWSNTLPDSGSMKGFLRKGIAQFRSQDLKPYYRLNGAIYICKTKRLLSAGSFFIEDNIFAYIMDNKSSVDIDSELDFMLASALLEPR